MEQRLRELEEKQRRREMQREAERKVAKATKSKKNKKRIVTLLPVIAILLAILVAFIIKYNTHPDYIIPPVNNSRAFVGVNYNEVKKKFTNLGFRNIQLKPLDDITDKNNSDINKVTSVTIRGETNFVEPHLFKDDEYKTYQWDDVVIISYHSLRK